MSSRVTPPVEEKGADMDEAIEARGTTVSDCREHSCASLHLTVAAFMAHMTWKWSKTGKGTEKWRKILVIVEGKMSLSRVTVSLYISMRERIK